MLAYTQAVAYFIGQLGRKLSKAVEFLALKTGFITTVPLLIKLWLLHQVGPENICPNK